jgi:hypothetical protein
MKRYTIVVHNLRDTPACNNMMFKLWNRGILASYLWWKMNGYGVMSRRQHSISKINYSITFRNCILSPDSLISAMFMSIQVHCMDTYNCLPWIFICFSVYKYRDNNIKQNTTSRFNIYINKRISLLNWYYYPCICILKNIWKFRVNNYMYPCSVLVYFQ